jgi:hypothetical protein
LNSVSASLFYSISHRMNDVANCPVSVLICSSSVMVKSSGLVSLSLLSSVSSFLLNFVCSTWRA